MDIKSTNFYKTALKLKSLLEASDEFAGLELDDAGVGDIPAGDGIDGEIADDVGIVAELKELMDTMTDEDKEVVVAAFDIIKKYAEEPADPDAVDPSEDAVNAGDVAPAEGVDTLPPPEAV